MHGCQIETDHIGSPLNRLSWLRTDHKFLTEAVKHPSTAFLLLNNLSPLAHDKTKLAFSSYTDVRNVIGDSPYTHTEEELISSYDSSKTIAQLVFLGLDERKSSDTSSLFTYTTFTGRPFFALDVTPKGSIASACEALISTKKSSGLIFLEGRTHMTLHAQEAAIVAQSRSMLDWNTRNPFCGGCGQPTLSINAGYKRTCPPTDMSSLAGSIGGTSGETPNKRADCATRKGVSNLCFPRTDPTVIMCCISADSTRILLGRQSRFPPNWYSCLAGFVEPAESVEEAVRREVMEESGIRLGRVVIHSTQPWPYPASLMIGAVGQAIPDGENIVLNDKELENARWFSVEEVREALRTGTGRLDELEKMVEAGPEGKLRLPPQTAIANQLLEAVCGGFAGREGALL